MKRCAWVWALMFAGVAGASASDPAPAAGDSKEAKEVLKKADEATKKVQAVRYVGSLRRTGAAVNFGPPVSGKAILAGKVEEGQGKFRCEVKLEGKDPAETREVTAGSDGSMFFLIDTKTKKVHEDMDPSVMGKGRVAGAILMREYAHPNPFGDEINADKAEFKDEKKIGSEDCYQIHVTYAKGQGEAIWFFSKKDFLPRGVERLFNREGQTGSTILEVTDLEVDPKLGDDAFKAVVPDGFTKTDEFAP